MNSTYPVEALLHRLSAGDAEAAERAFVAYAPILRMVVRRQLTDALRAKFDSTDIVQSIWADLLTGFRTGRWVFTNAQQLRAFLIKVTRNRLIDRVRQQQTPLRLEQRLALDDLHAVPETRPVSAGAQLEADEIWQRLLALCPAQHRVLLELKRQGLTAVAIATQTGLHEGSVRRILTDLATRFAAAGAPI